MNRSWGSRRVVLVSTLQLVVSAAVTLGGDGQPVPPPVNPNKITEVRTRFEVYSLGRDRGVIAVELHLGDVIRRWSYGAGLKWEVGFFTRFEHRLDADAAGQEPRVFVEVKDRPDEVGIVTGLKTQVFLYFADGRAREFRGERLFNTARGENLLELKPVVAGVPGRTDVKTTAPTPNAQLAKSPGVPSAAGAGAARFYSRLWSSNRRVRVAFQADTSKGARKPDGCDKAEDSRKVAERRRKVALVASEWVAGTSLTLDFGADLSNPQDTAFHEWGKDAGGKKHDIRVSLSADENGSWSLIGTDSLTLGATGRDDTESMNIPLSAFDEPEEEFRATVLHEFGHALGLPHVFQDPTANVDFLWEDDPGYVPTKDWFGSFLRDTVGRRPGVYTLLGAPPQNWSRAVVDFNLRPDPGLALPVRPSRDSVMMYSFRPEYLREGERSPWYLAKRLSKLSDFDRKLIALMYPKREGPGEGVTGAREAVEDARRTLADPKRGVAPAAAAVPPDDLKERWQALKAAPANAELQGAQDPRLRDAWVQDFLMSRNFVCRFKARTIFLHPILGRQSADQGFGTGILVSSSLVLTVNHVVPTPQVARSCVVEFTPPQGGAAAAFDLDGAAIVHSSPVGELDFSLLRLRPGADGKPPGSQQGYYPLLTSDLNREALYPHTMLLNLIHHGGGEATRSYDLRGHWLKLLNDRFVAYDALTSGGSSGAPVFNDAWWLIALHRGKQQKDDEKNDEYKDYGKGVRIDKIIDAIRAKKDSGLLSELGLLEK